MEPCPAHRYLSYLAREGLVTEIITTNFDTCLEKAFERSFLPVETISAMRGAQDTLTPLAVVTSLDRYRRFGAVGETNDHPHARPVIKLYKINGCARALTVAEPKHGKTEPAEDIMLTEQQLHSMRRQPWVEDLFCDRARSRALVFSGFGSDEPQVRHTVLTLLEEFTVDRIEDRVIGVEELADLPNAPWIAAFEAELSYSQLQILFAFRKAHNRSTNVGHCAHHAFTGRDVKYFDGAAKEEKLSADVSWRRVFQGVYLALLWRHTSPAGRFYQWLGDSMDKPEVARDRFMNWLDPDGVGRGLSVREGKNQFPEPKTAFGRFAWLLEEPSSSQSDTVGSQVPQADTSDRLVLSTWLLAMMTVRDGARDVRKLPDSPGEFRLTTKDRDTTDNFYVPLREDPLVVLAALFVLYRLANAMDVRDDTWREWVHLDGPMGLAIRIPSKHTAEQVDTAEQVELHVHLVRRGVLPEGPIRLPGAVLERSSRSRIHWFVDIPSAVTGMRQGRIQQVTEEPKESRTIFNARYERISARDLVRVELGRLGDFRRCYAQSPRRRQTRARLEPDRANQTDAFPAH